MGMISCWFAPPSCLLHVSLQNLSILFGIACIRTIAQSRIVRFADGVVALRISITPP